MPDVQAKNSLVSDCSITQSDEALIRTVTTFSLRSKFQKTP